MYPNGELHNLKSVKPDREEKKAFKSQIVWFNALGFLALHMGAVYGIIVIVTSASVLTTLWCK